MRRFIVDIRRHDRARAQIWNGTMVLPEARKAAATREANPADLRTAGGFPVATPVRANALAERRQPPMLNIAFDEAARS
jgi:hypothetical protein